MKNSLRILSAISLIIVVMLMILTKGEWVRLLTPFISIVDEQSNLIQSIDSLINIFLVILNSIWIYFSWIVKKSGEKNLFDEPPIIQINLDKLLARLGGYGSAVPWVDRDATNISLIRSNPRILILGQRKFGKTREAIELIRSAINHELVSETRIFQLSRSFRFYDPSVVKRSIEMNIDLSDPALLFIDDFVHYHFTSSLILIEETIEVLKKCREFYLIITASEDEMADQHLEWFEKNRFSLVRLGQLSKDQIEEFLEGAAQALNLLIDGDAREIFVDRSNGIPENVMIGLRRLLVEGRKVIDKDLALETTYHSLVDSWLSLRGYISERKPAAEFILLSLATFRSALVTPYPPLILAYASQIWRGKRKDKWLPNRNKQLNDALKYLSRFEYGLIAGHLLVSDSTLENDETYENARNALGKFLIDYKSLLRGPILSKIYRNADIHSHCLFDIAYISQSRFEFAIAIRHYSEALKLQKTPWIYINRGSAHGELGEVEAAIADFNRAEQSFKDHPVKLSVYYNRSLAHISEARYEKAMIDIETGLSMNPNASALIRNRAIVSTERGNVQQAINDFNLIIDRSPDGVDKALSYFARGNAHKKINELRKATKDYSRAIALTPNIPMKVDIYRSRGNIYSELGHHELAVDDYGKAIRLEPKNVHAILSRAHEYLQLENYGDALNDLNAVIKVDQKHAMAYFMRAQIYTELNAFDKAFKEIDKSLVYCDSDGFKSMALVHRGKLFSQVGEAQSAISDFDAALRLEPNYSHAYYGKAKAFEMMKDFENVISNCTQALELETNAQNSVELYNLRGSAFDELGKYDNAIGDFQAAIGIDKENAVAHMNYGITLSRIGELDDALKYLNKAISLNPRLWEAYGNRGKIYSDLGEHEKAISSHNVLVENTNDPQKKASALYNRGNTYMSLDKYRKAINDFSEAIEFLEDRTIRASCYYRRGLCYFAQGNEVDALSDLNNSIKLDRENSWAYILRGNIRSKMRQTEQAISDFGHAIALASGDLEKAEAYKLRGTRYSEIGNYVQGILDYNSAISLDSQDAVHYFNRGTSYLMVAKFEKALSDFDNALKLNPEYPEVYNNRAIIYSALGDYEKAIIDLDLAINLFDSPEEKASPYRKKAILLSRLGRHKEALDIFQLAEKMAPNDAMNIATKVEMEYHFENYPETLKLIQQSESTTLHNESFILWKALVLFHLGRSTEALKALNTHFDISPPLINLHIIHSELINIKNQLEPSDEIEEAIKVVEDYIKSSHQGLGEI